MAVIEAAGAGDIISMAGLSGPAIGHTVANPEVVVTLCFDWATCCCTERILLFNCQQFFIFIWECDCV
jgi:hypothetical protein